MTAKRWVALVVTLVILAGLGVGGYFAYRYLYQRMTPERCTVTVGEHEVTLTREQARNASIIVAASVERGLPERAAIIALATAYQESGLRNLDYGDRDSLGLFQQRPSYGWGTEEEIMDPWYTSNRFYEELVKFDNWETTDINDMAQKVQRSGFPEAYRKHVENATAVAKSFLGAPQSVSCVNFSIGEANAKAVTPALDAISAAYGVEGSQIHIANTEDTTKAWSAVNMALANSYEAGISAATFGELVWEPDGSGWGKASSHTDIGAAVLTLGP